MPRGLSSLYHFPVDSVQLEYNANQVNNLQNFDRMDIDFRGPSHFTFMPLYRIEKSYGKL